MATKEEIIKIKKITTKTRKLRKHENEPQKTLKKPREHGKINYGNMKTQKKEFELEKLEHECTRIYTN